MYKRNVTISFAFVLLFSINVFAKSSEDELKELFSRTKWEMQYKGENYGYTILNADGTASKTSDKGYMEQKGTWSIENGALITDFPGEGRTAWRPKSISKDKIVMESIGIVVEWVWVRQPAPPPPKPMAPVTKPIADEELKKMFVGTKWKLQVFDGQHGGYTVLNTDGTASRTGETGEQVKGAWSIAGGKIKLDFPDYGAFSMELAPKAISNNEIVMVDLGTNIEWTWIRESTPTAKGTPSTEAGEDNPLPSCEELKELSDSMLNIEKIFDKNARKFTEGDKLDEAIGTIVSALEDIATVEVEASLSDAVKTLAYGYDKMDSEEFRSGLKRTRSILDDAYRRDCR